MPTDCRGGLGQRSAARLRLCPSAAANSRVRETFSAEAGGGNISERRSGRSITRPLSRSGPGPVRRAMTIFFAGLIARAPQTQCTCDPNYTSSAGDEARQAFSGFSRLARRVVGTSRAHVWMRSARRGAVRAGLAFIAQGQSLGPRRGLSVGIRGTASNPGSPTGHPEGARG